MPQEFYDKDSLSGVQRANEDHWTGYALVFDIKDSTSRKRGDATRWYSQTDAFYKGLRGLAISLQKLSKADAFKSYFSSLESKDKKVVVKFIGDCGFIFVPLAYGSAPKRDNVAPKEISYEILKLASAFRKETHDTDALGGLRLKTVVTYLTGVRPVRFGEIISDGRGDTIEEKIEIPTLDILGQGIDLTFRLEMFADQTHIVINTEIAKSLLEKENIPLTEKPFTGYSIDIETEKNHVIQCKKKIKGWDDPLYFYLLVAELNETPSLVFSPDRRDVEAEIFQYHLEIGRKPAIIQDSMPPSAEVMDGLLDGSSTDDRG